MVTVLLTLCLVQLIFLPLGSLNMKLTGPMILWLNVTDIVASTLIFVLPFAGTELSTVSGATDSPTTGIVVLLPLYAAVILVVPAAWTVTRPVFVTVAIFALPDKYEAWEVTFVIMPLL